MDDAFAFRVSSHPPRVAGIEPASYDTFDRASGDAAVILSSNWGLTTYLTVPARLVRCDARTLWLLLSDLDATYWMLGDTDLTVVSLIHAPVGSDVIAADGSVARVVDGVWMDRQFVRGIREQAREVVSAGRSRLDLTLVRAERDREMERRRRIRSTGSFATAWDFDIYPPTYLLKPFEWNVAADRSRRTQV